MTAPLRSPSPAACPGCLAAPADSVAPQADAAAETALSLSLPTIHCAACISTVENTLSNTPGVESARVNLTLKRVSVEAPGLTAQDLIPVLARVGYEAHELDAAQIRATETDRAGRDLLMRLAVAGFAAMNIMLLSVAVWSGAEGATRDMFHWISAAIAFPAIAFSGKPFFTGAWSALRVGRLNMDVPIALAIALALATSLWETALSGHHAYFDAAVTLTFFLLAGRYLDHRTRAIARSAAEELAALEVPRAIRLEDDGTEATVAVADLRVGDTILLRPGARAPVDGEILTGFSEIDRSALTGESVPVQAAPGGGVSAGEVNLTGPLTLRATAVGRDSALHRLADLVAIAESGRARYTSLADKAAKLYAPGVHILSALAFAGWYLGTGDLRLALNIAAAVLIITCPCALGLAVPAVTTAASGRLFKRGMLIKHETALERLAEVDTVVFDKTGTLTEGTPELSAPDSFDDETLALAMGLAEASAHPLSQAILRAGEARGLRPAHLSEIREVPGFGTQATLGTGETAGRVRLGRADWVGATGVAQETSAWLALPGRAPLRFGFTDALRPGAAEAVAGLQAAGKRVILMSGDATAPVEAMAARLGIADWLAEARPEDKAARIAALTDDGHRVLMVGDGLNDTAALAAAHVSISPASALDAARVASDIVLLGRDLSELPTALTTAAKATRRIRENFQIATVYNVLAVPLAAAGLCSPLIAALAMSTSSITVSLNALRLK